MSHRTELKVRGFHCDAYGHVNNARYLEFFEEGRWSALEAHGLIKKFNELGLQFYIVNINLNFKLALLPDQHFVVETSLGEVGRKTLTFHQEIKVEDKTTTTADITFVLFSAKEKKAVTVTDEIVDYFRVF